MLKTRSRPIRRRSRDQQAAYRAYLQVLEERILMAASQVVFAQQPAATGAAVGISLFPAVTVFVEDTTGAVVPGDTSTVVLTIASGPVGATINGATSSSITAVNGIATFSSLVFNVAGNYTLAVSDGTLASPAPSSAFPVGLPPAQLAFSIQPTNIVAGSPFPSNILVNIEDSTDNIVPSDHSNVTLSIAPGSQTGGTITGLTTVTASDGVATFSNVTLPVAGTYELLATDGTISTTSSTFVVSAGTAAKVGFVQQPTQTPQSIVISPSVTVAVEDPFGNIITSDNSSISISVGSGPGILSGTTTVQATDGLATFSDLSLPTIGSYTLLASDGSLTNGTSNSFAITGPATHLVFQQQPVQTTIGATILPPVVVDVEDVNNNILFFDTSSVTIAIASGPGTLGGTLTVNAVHGVATFSDLTINMPGTHKLFVTDGVLDAATSSSFIITGTAAQLAFQVQPTAVAANSPVVPSVTVDVQDSSGFLVNNDTSNVFITVFSGPGAIIGNASASAVAGVATFNDLVFSLPGTYRIEAADGSLTPVISLSFTVSPPPSQLLFSQEPVNTAAGSPMFPAVVVDVTDDVGHVITTDNSTVTLMIVNGPVGSSLGGNFTATASHGVATFSNITFAMQGNYTLIAADGNLATATSSPFTITGPASKISFLTNPSNVVAGHTMSNFTVIVQDSKNNIVTSDHSTVTLAILNGPANATITGNKTVTVVNGEANFNDIILPIAGSYSFSVSDGSLRGVNTQHSITVSPDPTTAHLVVTQTPGSTVVGGSLAPQLQISVEDKNGNIITSDGSKITLSIRAGGPASTFFNNTTASTVTVSHGIANFSGISLPKTGNYTLIAKDSLIATGTTSFSQTITPGLSFFSSAPSSKSFVYGKPVSFSGTIKSSAPVNNNLLFSGSVSIFTTSGGLITGTLGTASISSSGSILVNIPADLATAGSLTTIMEVAPDAFHTGTSSAPFTITITPSATSTALALSATHITSPTGVTLTATVTSSNAPTIDRTGSIEFKDNGVTINTIALVNNVAMLPLSTPTVGNHTYTAVYEPDNTDFLTSTSSIKLLTVT